MATYLILNLLFIAVVLVALKITPQRPGRAILVTLAVLIALTALFDNFIVGFSIVGYDPAKILGIMVVNAPIEDFMYAVLAVIIIPVLWRNLGVSRAKQS